MSASNSQIRNHTAFTLQTKFGRFILLKLAYLAAHFLPLAWLISSPLKVGYIHGLVELVRGNNAKVNVVFSRVRNFLACILLPIWKGLKMLVWVLPGLLIAMVGGCLAINPGEEIMTAIGGIIGLAGIVTSIVMVIRAYFSYRMAHLAFADNPELDVYDAVEYSKKMMDGRKFHLFCLTIPYLLYMILIIVADALLTFVAAQLLSSLPGLMMAISLLASLAAIAGIIYISLLSELAVVCFYEDNHD